MCQIKNKFLVKDATRQTAYKIVFKNKSSYNSLYNYMQNYEPYKIYNAEGLFYRNNSKFISLNTLFGNAFHVYTSLKAAKYAFTKIRMNKRKCVIVKVYVNKYIASGISSLDDIKTACYSQIIFTNETYRK